MFHVVIPARYAASRLPGKPLLMLGDKTLLQWVWMRAKASGARSVLIATDDDRIRVAAVAFGADAMMTSPEHASGTDRMAEVVQARGFAADEVIVNLQGDEPMMPAEVIGRVAEALQAAPQADLATAAAPIQSLEEFLDPNCVKVVCGRDGRALYFSRAPLPWPRDHQADGQPTQFAGALRHIGIYAYRVHSLTRFAAWTPSPLERLERLEQLRALEHGMHVQVVTLDAMPPAGVDTPRDLERVRALLKDH